MKCPDFIGIGGHKCGTSWLAAVLNSHPQIWMPCKETQFFTKRWNKGPDWYLNLFDLCPPNTICGEFSTTYLTTPVAIDRIKQIAPNAKLLAIIREPVSRALSHWRFIIKNGYIEPSTSLRQACSLYPDIILNGKYELYTQAWHDKFNILWIDYEDIDLSQIYYFLDVDPNFKSPLANTRINISNPIRTIWGSIRYREWGRKLRSYPGLKQIWFRWWFIHFRQWALGIKPQLQPSQEDLDWLRRIYYEKKTGISGCSK